MATQAERLSGKNGLEPFKIGTEVGIGNGDTHFNSDSLYLGALADEFKDTDRFMSLEIAKDLQIPQSLLSNYVRSAGFRTAVLEAANRVDRFSSTSEFIPWLYGHLFAGIAWHAISQSSEGILLPEDYVVDTLREVAGVQTHNDEYGRDAAVNVYIPDAILVKNAKGAPKIDSIFEFTTSTHFNKFQSQIHGLKRTRERLASVCAKDAGIYFVVPDAPAEETEAFEDYLKRTNKSLKGEIIDFKVISVPVTRAEIGMLTRRVLEEFSVADDSQTMGEVIREREAMLDRICVGKKAKNVELGRQIVSGFDNNCPEARDYVARWMTKHERPIKGSRVLTGITLPRITPQSMGEPSVGLWREPIQEE